MKGAAHDERSKTGWAEGADESTGEGRLPEGGAADPDEAGIKRMSVR